MFLNLLICHLLIVVEVISTQLSCFTPTKHLAKLFIRKLIIRKFYNNALVILHM